MSRTPRVTDTARRKALVYLGAGLALAGAGTATAAAGFSASPAGAARLDVASAAVAGQPAHQARVSAVTGHAGGDLRRSVRLTRRSHGIHRSQRQSWADVSLIVAKQTTPSVASGPLPAADKLTPAGTSGPQTWMPVTAARYASATTIVRQALARHMGLRSAVIAVATSMQESALENLPYGDRDSLGLFQQRPSCGWGTPAQILHPAYAADAFLGALSTYQGNNPSWASQPLWQSAQGVQQSGFPYAYAKWEAQAASLVATITPHLV
jgi:hypothetical protein